MNEISASDDPNRIAKRFEKRSIAPFYVFSSSSFFFFFFFFFFFLLLSSPFSFLSSSCAFQIWASNFGQQNTTTTTTTTKKKKKSMGNEILFCTGWREDGAEGENAEKREGVDDKVAEPTEVERGVESPSTRDSRDSDLDRVAALMDKGYEAYDSHEWQDAIACFSDAERLAQLALKSGHLSNESRGALLNHRGRALGNVATYETLGDHARAIAAYKPCIEILEQRGEEAKAVKVLNNMVC